MRASIGSLFAIVPFRLPPRCSCPGQRRRAWMMTIPPPLPAILRHWMAGLLDAFSPRTQGQVLTLVAGAVLAPGRRTVASALRVMGLAEAPTFTSYHRVLNRNGWSSRELARRLLRLLVRRLVPEGPIIVGLDDTLERRRHYPPAARPRISESVASAAATGVRFATPSDTVPAASARRSTRCTGPCDQRPRSVGPTFVSASSAGSVAVQVRSTLKTVARPGRPGALTAATSVAVLRSGLTLNAPGPSAVLVLAASRSLPWHSS